MTKCDGFYKSKLGDLVDFSKSILLIENYFGNSFDANIVAGKSGIHYISVKISNISTTWVSPVGIYLLKVNNRNTRTRCEIFLNLTMRRSDVFIVNFEHISHLLSSVSILLVLPLNM